MSEAKNEVKRGARINEDVAMHTLSGPEFRKQINMASRVFAPREDKEQVQKIIDRQRALFKAKDYYDFSDVVVTIGRAEGKYLFICSGWSHIKAWKALGEPATAWNVRIVAC